MLTGKSKSRCCEGSEMRATSSSQGVEAEECSWCYRKISFKIYTEFTWNVLTLHVYISSSKRHVPRRLERQLTERFTARRCQWLPRDGCADGRDPAGRAAQRQDNHQRWPWWLLLLRPTAREVNNQQPMIIQLLLISWHCLAWKMGLNCSITAGSSTATAWTSLWQTALKLLARNSPQRLSFFSLPLIHSYQNENVSSSLEKAIAKRVDVERASRKDFS